MGRKRKSLGCFTTAGLIALLVSLLAVGTSYALTRAKMFSPGKLAAQTNGVKIGGVTSHTELEQDCAACHPAPWSFTRMMDLCLNCHVEIEEEMAVSSTMHGAIASTFEDVDCRDCHTDHRGADAKITNYLGSDFPHELVGFALDAHHAVRSMEIVCTDCHVTGFTSFGVAACQDCHEEVDMKSTAAHEVLFGTACLECHDGVETYGSDFSHDDYYPLIGEHMGADCAGCHTGAKDLAMLRDAPQECYTCHRDKDVHLANLGRDCQTCHSPLGWEQASYDHTGTGFLLVGGHKGLECDSCHLDQTFLNLVADCSTCHLDDDPHELAFGDTCDACHVVTSWQEVSFDHAVAGVTDCQSCHSGDAPNNHYPGQCSACHVTAAWLPASFDHAVAGATDCQACHSGDAPNNHYSGQCSACHTTAAWLPATFNHAAAGATNCIACHSGNAPANHFSGQCSACHSTSAWLPANFAHSFPLNHGGAGSQCSLCHTTQNYSAYTCYGCHEHNQANIRNEHENVSNLDNCLRCHFNGRSEGGDGGGGDDDD